MNNIIERYVYDVVRRLPEKDREEVSEELKSNIYDMLPDIPNEDMIKEVLYDLGNPRTLAEEYRQNPHYLISPAMYDEYIRVLKWVLPLIGGILVIIGVFSGTFSAISAGDGVVEIKDLLKEIISSGISLAVNGIFQVLIWITAGFVVVERTGTKETSKDNAWKLEDLPEVSDNKKKKIPLSDIIIEAVMTLVFTGFIILSCSSILPIHMGFSYKGVIVNEVFTSGFLTTCIPVFIIIAIFAIGEYICKFIERRWSPLVCTSVIISNLVSMSGILYLFTRPNIFSNEFINFARDNQWGSHDIMRFIGQESNNPIILGFLAIVIIITLISCGTAIYKTIKEENKA